MMNDSIEKKTLKSVAWTSVDRFGALAIQFIVTSILARLLEPADFGMVGMLALFMAVGSLLIDSGFSHTLIQKENVSNQDYSTVFLTNILIGITLYGVLFIAAPGIACFFNTPQLTTFARTIFLMFPINALCVVHLAKLTRELQFKTIAKISIYSALVSGGVGISVALCGYGIWALIFQQLSLYVSRVILYWLFVRWYPTTWFNRRSFRTLWKFSMNLLGTGVIVTIFDNIYVFIVGRFFPLDVTGYFNQAWQMGTMLPSLITGVVSKAAFPIFCQVNKQRNPLSDISRKTLHANLFISIPCMFGVMVMAPNIFTAFFSEKWLPSVPLFRIICIYGAFMPIRVVNTDAIKACGKGKLYLGLETFQRCLVLISILLSIKQGIPSLLWGRTIACLAALLIDMYLCGKAICLPMHKQLQEQWRVVVATLFMMLVLYSIDKLADAPFLILPIQCIIGAISYFAACCLLQDDLAIRLYNKVRQYAHNR